jgi:glycosidase
MNAFIDMVGLFKDNNIKVYLDFVPNHSSNLNPYFKK